MTLLERLQAHKGGLIRIKSQLFWYSARGWDGSPGRICLVLDASDGPPAEVAATAAAAGAATMLARSAAEAASALLLIDGSPRWIWAVDEDIELLDGGDR